MIELQKINLYTDAFRPKREPLMAQQLLVIAGVFVVVLILCSLWSWQQGLSLSGQVVAAQKELADIEQRVIVLRNRQQQSLGPKFEREINQLQQQLIKRQQIHSLIQSQNLGNAKGFSAQLNDMAKESISSLSLQAFALHHGGAYFEMSGWAKNADAVPRYLQNLRTAESFERVRLGVLSVERLKARSNALYFTVSKPAASENSSQQQNAVNTQSLMPQIFVESP